jgi:GH24 family phage-related lysozyme (muramidase)
MPNQSFYELLARLGEASAAEGAIRSDREPDLAPPGLETREAPALSATPISRPAIDLIIAAEVTSKAHYTAKLTHPIWPGGSSGVTIGIGYDVGTVDPGELRTDWNAELAGPDVAALAEACGVLGASAAGLIAGLAFITVSYDLAERVFLQRSVPAFVSETERALPNTVLLSPDSLGALVSLAYNRGASGFSKPGERYREMRAIRTHMADQEFDQIPDEIRSMKRLWENDPNARGLVLRREAEAVLFSQGL